MDSKSGSQVYAAPEIIDNEDYDSKVDVFSLGVVLYELLIGARQSISILWRGKGKGLPEKFSEPTRALYEWMISVEPKERPSIYSVYGRMAPFNEDQATIDGLKKEIDILKKKITQLE